MDEAMDKTTDKTTDKAMQSGNAPREKRKRGSVAEEEGGSEDLAASVFTPIQPNKVLNALFEAHTTLVQVQSFLTHLRRDSSIKPDNVNMNAHDVQGHVDRCIPQLKKEMLTMFDVYVRASTDDADE